MKLNNIPLTLARRTVFCATLFYTLLTHFALGVSTEYAKLGPDGKLVYMPHNNAGETDPSKATNVIPDFSNAGYMGGGVRLPVGKVPVKQTVSPGSGNDLKAIQDAIDKVCALEPDENGYRGAVLIKAGSYLIDDIPNATEVNDIKKWMQNTAFHVWASGVVIRGEGQGSDGTVIQTTVKKPHGIFMFAPKKTWIMNAEIDRVAITDDYIGTGATSFTVANIGNYKVGDRVRINYEFNTTWEDDIDLHAKAPVAWQEGYIDYPENDDNAAEKYENNRFIYYEREIIAIDSATKKITIHSPLFQPWQPRWGEITMSRAENVNEGGDRLENCGIEDLRIVGYKAELKKHKVLQKSVIFCFVYNGWAHGVTSELSGNSTVCLYNSHYVTIEECAYVKGTGGLRGFCRYSFKISGVSTHNLVQRCYSQRGRHDYVMQARVPGPNVFLDCVAVEGFTNIGPHHRYATGTLFDNIFVGNSTNGVIALAVSEHRINGGSGHGWSAGQCVGWNVDADRLMADAPLGHNNYIFGGRGQKVGGKWPYNKSDSDNVFLGVYDPMVKDAKNRRSVKRYGQHVTPRSLYLTQLKDRLGSAVLDNVIVQSQREGTIYENLIAWAGEGAYPDEAVDADTCTVTLQAAPNGYVHPYAEPSLELNKGENTFTVYPHDGYIIDQVKAGDELISIDGNQFSVSVTNDITLSVSFKEK